MMFRSKFFFMFILLSVCCNLIYGVDVEIRKPGDCGIRKVKIPDQQDNDSSSSGEHNNQDNKDKSKQILEEKKKFPKKVIIERPRLIARIRYLKEWDENPFAIRNLLLFIEDALKIKAVNINSHSDIKLSTSQTMSVLNQLKDFEISLEDTDDNTITTPILSGDIASAIDSNEVISTFEVLKGEEKQNADSFLMLHMTGQHDFNLNDKQINALRSYIVRGGFVFADCASGNQEFGKGFMRLMKKMFPDNELEQLKKSHPVFSTIFDLKKIRYTGAIKSEGGAPRIKGLKVGCRTAVFFSKDTLSCGWDGHMHGEFIDYEMHYDDALKFGCNLIAYALGYRELGAPLQKVIVDSNKLKYKGETLALARIKFQGDFDTNYFGVHAFLRFLREHMNADVYPKPLIVDLAKDDLSIYPFLFISGHGKFNFSSKELKQLKLYLDKGGKLFAESCCGDSDFDISFRGLCKTLFPDKSLSWLKPNHPVYTCFYKLRNVSYRVKGKMLLKTLLLKKVSKSRALQLSKQMIPYLEGIEQQGGLAVIYSPIDLGCAWEKRPCLICKGLMHQDDNSLKLGLNIIFYMMQD